MNWQIAAWLRLKIARRYWGKTLMPSVAPCQSTVCISCCKAWQGGVQASLRDVVVGRKSFFYRVKSECFMSYIHVGWDVTQTNGKLRLPGSCLALAHCLLPFPPALLRAKGSENFQAFLLFCGCVRKRLDCVSSGADDAESALL